MCKTCYCCSCCCQDCRAPLLVVVHGSQVAGLSVVHGRGHVVDQRPQQRRQNLPEVTLVDAQVVVIVLVLLLVDGIGVVAVVVVVAAVVVSEATVAAIEHRDP